MKCELEVTKTSYEELKLECEALQNCNFELMQMIGVQHEEKSALARHLASISELREILQSQLAEVEVSLGQAQSQNTRYQNDIRELGTCRGELQQELVTLQERCTELTDTRSQQEERVKDLQGQIVLLKDTVETRQLRLDEAVKAQSDAQTRIQQVGVPSNTKLTMSYYSHSLLHLLVVVVFIRI